MVCDPAGRCALREMSTGAEFRGVRPRSWSCRPGGAGRQPCYPWGREASGSPLLPTTSAIQAMASGTS